MKENALPKLLDIPALAEHLGVTERHIRRLVFERRIPYIKWGHLIRFDPGEVKAWLDAARKAPGEEAPETGALSRSRRTVLVTRRHFPREAADDRRREPPTQQASSGGAQ